jgi:hypothetical protein
VYQGPPEGDEDATLRLLRFRLLIDGQRLA